MLKWLLTTVIALAILTAAMPWLAKRFGIGRMPGDLQFTLGGKPYVFPLASTLILTFFAWLVGRLI